MHVPKVRNLDKVYEYQLFKYEKRPVSWRKLSDSF